MLEILGVPSSTTTAATTTPAPLVASSSNNESHITISDMFSIKSSSSSSNNTSGNKMKSAGVTLLIMLFSFGLLFNVFGSHRLVTLNRDLFTSNNNIVLPPASVHHTLKSVAPSMIRNILPTTMGRTLQEHSAPLIEGEHHDKHKASPTPIISRSSFEELNESKRGDISPVLSKTIQEDTITSIFLNEFANESKDSLEHKKLSEEAQQLNTWFNDNIDVQNNTAYLLTDEVQQLIPIDPAPFDTNSPLKISLLIPSHHHTSIADSDNILLEVHCEVLNIKGYQVTANLVPKLAIAQ
jgi:hypothetical protein